MNFLRNPRYYLDGLPAVGLLFLRIFVGYAMASHGLVKIAHPFSWMQMENPSIVMQLLQALAAVSEFFGGIALIFGLLTPLACLGIMSTMFVATMVNLSNGLPLIDPVSSKSAEASALHFIAGLTIFLTGPGLLSLDYFLFGRKRAAATTP